MDEFNIPLQRVYELAAERAVEIWGEFRYLAGLDSSAAGLNYAHKTDPRTMAAYKRKMETWSKIADYLYSVKI